MDRQRSVKAKRNSRIAAAALGGVGVAFIILFMPVGLLEMLVASSGFSETLPAAAPPLGLKARLVMAGSGALMGMGIIWAGHREVEPVPFIEEGRTRRVEGARKMGFALSKLSWLTGGRKRTTARGWTLRRADAHPDAPARTPIFASRDFSGLDIFTPRSPQENMGEGHPVPLLSSPPVHAPNENIVFESLGTEAMDAEFEEIAAPAPVGERKTPPSVYSLSIPELTARLEQGLAKRKRAPRPMDETLSVLADMPVASPVPVRDHVDEEIDEALRSALGTLRSMAGRAR